MDGRQERGLVIAATCRVRNYGKKWSVPSQTQEGTRYTVIVTGDAPNCSCPDFETRGVKCKHLWAVEYVMKRERYPDGSTTVTESMTVTETVKKTYKQDWPAYNAAQTTEKNWFLSLLADLCSTIPEPERKPGRGRPAVRLADSIFAACYKVYSGFSARRFTCDLESAAEAGHITKAIHFNSVLNVLDTEAATTILYSLIQRSASPLREVESEWAVDSSGFSGCKFLKWFDEKYGAPKKYAAWVKAHIICGTRTNVIAAAEILDSSAADSPRLPGLVKTTAQTFKVNEVAADKAYTGTDNFNAVDAVGGTLYAAFKTNATGAAGGLFGKMFHYFALNKEEYMAHYHRRSMIESTFSAVKRKFGDSVRAKTDLAMKNETLAKFVCQNITCVISAIYERGIDPTFLGLSGETVGPRDVLRFPPLAHKINRLHIKSGPEGV